ARLGTVRHGFCQCAPPMKRGSHAVSVAVGGRLIAVVASVAAAGCMPGGAASAQGSEARSHQASKEDLRVLEGPEAVRCWAVKGESQDDFLRVDPLMCERSAAPDFPIELRSTVQFDGNDGKFGQALLEDVAAVQIAELHSGSYPVKLRIDVSG